MSDNIETNSQSWGDTLREASANVTDQPDTESEDVAEGETVEEQSGSDVEDGEEVAEEQPEGDSETETPLFTDDTEIELGEDRKPVKVSELKAGYLRQSDYTKKTQELASLRQEVETQRESLKNTQNWLDYINSNPWLFNQIDLAIKEFNETGVLPLQEALQDAQYGKYINHLAAENNALKKQLDGLKGEYEGVKLTSEMTRLQNDLKAEYGELVTDDYMQSLQERAKNERLSFSLLKDIADGHLAKQKLKTQPSTKQTEAKTIQKLQETRKAAPATPKPSAEAPKTPQEVDTSGSWMDFLKRSSKK